jgi:hypothetical protein
LYQIRNLKGAADQPSDFKLYSVALANLASNVPSKLIDAVYEPTTTQLATAAAVGRLSHEPVLTVWDLTDKKPVIELFPDPAYFSYLWETQLAQIHFSDRGIAMEVCLQGTGIRVDIDLESWQAQACKMAGRNLTRTEGWQFIGNQPYRSTCSQWPAGK